ncbi:MAG: hypothetical protein ACAH83_09495 [Alphaproteobacteria bacterium]
MFSKKVIYPKNLSDEALQKKLGALEKRDRLVRKIGVCLLCLACAVGLAAGGTGGVFFFMAFTGDTGMAAALGGVIGGALGTGGAACVTGGIKEFYRELHEFETRQLADELKSRAVEEARKNKPLDAAAREAFILSLNAGTRSNVEILKPLRLKTRAGFGSPTLS